MPPSGPCWRCCSLLTPAGRQVWGRPEAASPQVAGHALVEFDFGEPTHPGSATPPPSEHDTHEAPRRHRDSPAGSVLAGTERQRLMHGRIGQLPPADTWLSRPQGAALRRHPAITYLRYKMVLEGAGPIERSPRRALR